MTEGMEYIITFLLVFGTALIVAGVISSGDRVEDTTNEVYYYQNVLPSQQCKGIAISDMNKTRLTASTGSMRPYIYSNDIILAIKYNPYRELVLGDVVTQNGVMHRIVAISHKSNQYQTKGDNNKWIDPEWIDFKETKRVVCGVLRGTR